MLQHNEYTNLINAQTISQLLLMQSVVIALPNEKSIFDFVIHGLKDIPGTQSVYYGDTPPLDSHHLMRTFPIVSHYENWGNLIFHLSDPNIFSPYEDYIKNFTFMLAVIFEERYQRRANQIHKIQLRNRIKERTKQLQVKILEQKQIENALRESEKQLRIAKENAERNLQIKSRFLDIAAHELRTPVSVFSVLLQLAQRQLRNGMPVDTTIIDRLKKQSDRLNRLVIDLLDVTRLERGGLELDKTNSDVTSLITEVLDGFMMQEPERQFIFKKLESPVIINIDPLRITQVLWNLIDNAIKYSPKDGPIEVKIELLTNTICISINDQGHEISELSQKELFQPFYRGNSDQAERTRGLGLGLYICKNIIELHGGIVGYISHPEYGNSFYFTLPQQKDMS